MSGFARASKELLETLAGAHPAEPVWSWSSDHTVRHYLRMLPIETVVHRWDAQSSFTRPDSISDELSVEGVGHTFEVMAPFRRTRTEAPQGRGESFARTSVDGKHTWWVMFMGDEVIAEEHPVGQPAAVSVRAAVSDLLLYLWGRKPATTLDVEGDARLLGRYFELVPPL